MHKSTLNLTQNIYNHEKKSQNRMMVGLLLFFLALAGCSKTEQSIVPGQEKTKFNNTSARSASSGPYLVGNWPLNSISADRLAIRQGNVVYMNFDFDNSPDLISSYGQGNSESEYFVGDWDGDGRDNFGVRRGSWIILQTSSDTYIEYYFSLGFIVNDEYLVGDWNGDRKDDIAIRSGNGVYIDYGFDGNYDVVTYYGRGNLEDQYLVGDWNGTGRDKLAVRRSNSILMNYDLDGRENFIQYYGRGNLEDEYLVGDWNGDRRDNLAVRRTNSIIMDYNFDGTPDVTQTYNR